MEDDLKKNKKMKTTSTRNQGWRRPQKEKEKKDNLKKNEDDLNFFLNGYDIIVN